MSSSELSTLLHTHQRLYPCHFQIPLWCTTFHSPLSQSMLRPWIIQGLVAQVSTSSLPMILLDNSLASRYLPRWQSSGPTKLQWLPRCRRPVGRHHSNSMGPDRPPRHTEDDRCGSNVQYSKDSVVQWRNAREHSHDVQRIHVIQDVYHATASFVSSHFHSDVLKNPATMWLHHMPWHQLDLRHYTIQSSLLAAEMHLLPSLDQQLGLLHELLKIQLLSWHQPLLRNQCYLFATLGKFLWMLFAVSNSCCLFLRTHQPKCPR